MPRGGIIRAHGEDTLAIPRTRISAEVEAVDWTLEVVIVPVSDIDRAIDFYRDRVGFELDHHTTNEHMDVAQLTPRGSGCSIVVGNLPSQTQMKPGSLKGLQLVVAEPIRESRFERKSAQA